MIVTVCSFKGGCGKTTTAVHLAAYFQTLAPTLLLDADENRNAINHNGRGEGLPFTVEPVDRAEALIPQFTHVVIDSGQRPEPDNLKAMARVSTAIVIPTPAEPYDIDSLLQTIRVMQQIAPNKFRVLLTKVSPPAVKDAAQLRAWLGIQKTAVFSSEIPLLRAYVKAAAEGLIVNQIRHDKNAARAWEAYAAAGKEITASWQ